MNVYEIVTERIISELQKGVIPWKKPYNVAAPEAINYVSRKPYSFLNTMLLGGRSGEYITPKQAEALGGTIREGATAYLVVFFKSSSDEEEAAESERGENNDRRDERRHGAFLRYYRVFHIDDVEGIESKLGPSEIGGAAANADGEQIVGDYFTREHVGLRWNDREDAIYNPETDEIRMPDISRFAGTDGYYGTLFKQIVHSTGSASRLDRVRNADRNSEELIGEMGGTMLSSIAGITTDAQIANAAAYCDRWIRNLRENPRMVVSCAGKATKAVKFIRGEV